MSDWSDNMDAINVYITTVPLKTPQATQLHDAWVAWYSGLSWLELNVTQSQATYDEARNRRLAFDQANAVTDADKAAVQNVATTGISTEQQAGQADRRRSDGTYAIPPAPLIPTAYKVAGAAAAGGTLVLVLLKKLRIL